MVSVIKTKEAAVACVLCICTQTITIVMSCVYSAMKSQHSAEDTVCKHSAEDTASQHNAEDTVRKHGRQERALFTQNAGHDCRDIKAASVCSHHDTSRQTQHQKVGQHMWRYTTADGCPH